MRNQVSHEIWGFFRDHLNIKNLLYIPKLNHLLNFHLWVVAIIFLGFLTRSGVSQEIWGDLGVSGEIWGFFRNYLNIKNLLYFYK